MVTAGRSVDCDPTVTLKYCGDGYYVALSQHGAPLVYADELNLGEMLGALISILVCGSIPPFMKTADEWITWEKEHEADEGE